MKKLLLEEDIKAVIVQISLVDKNIDKNLLLLQLEYGFTLTKTELAKVLKISEQTIDRRIKESRNIPKFLRSSDSKKASYIFPTIYVAEYLERTVEIL